MTETLDIVKLGKRVRSLRQNRGFSLQEISERSSVSASMLSAVERGQKVASIKVLHQIAMALKISVGRLIESEDLPRVITLRRDEQTLVTRGAGWSRKVLSPFLPGFEFELTRTVIEPGVEAGEVGPLRSGTRAFLSVEAGALTMILDGRILQLDAGDSISYAGDCRSVFRNDGENECICYLSVNLEPAAFLRPIA